MAVCFALGALLFAAPAQARPCADPVDVRVKGISHIVFTGDGRYERRNLPCSALRAGAAGRGLHTTEDDEQLVCEIVDGELVRA